MGVLSRAFGGHGGADAAAQAALSVSAQGEVPGAWLESTEVKVVPETDTGGEGHGVAVAWKRAAAILRRPQEPRASLSRASRSRGPAGRLTTVCLAATPRGVLTAERGPDPSMTSTSSSVSRLSGDAQ